MLAAAVALATAAAAAPHADRVSRPAAAETVGYYSWNWGKGSTGPERSTVGIAFTGLIGVEAAINGYDIGAGWCCPALQGERYLSLGGGNAAGIFDENTIKAITTDMHLAAAANYSGIVYDAEICVGSAETLVPLFKASFAEAKRLGLKTIVTVSHSAPYQTDTPDVAVDLMKAWLTDPNVDIISPQLYSSGTETKPDFDTTYNCRAAGCTWDLYQRRASRFVPSIVGPEQYSEVVSYFQSTHGIAVEGYLQWRQDA